MQYAGSGLLCGQPQQTDGRRHEQSSRRLSSRCSASVVHLWLFLALLLSTLHLILILDLVTDVLCTFTFTHASALMLLECPCAIPCANKMQASERVLPTSKLT